MTYSKITNWFLAISTFMFGMLKLVNPFKHWYTVQVTNSGLGHLSYVVGIAGEIAVGATLLCCLLYRKRIAARAFTLLTILSYLAIILMMLVAIYVHLHPHVPASVLPLKIKGPYIPLFFLWLAASNLFLSVRKVLVKRS